MKAKLFNIGLVLGLLTFMIQSGISQPYNVQTAYNHLDNGNLVKAKKAIDKAVEHEKTKNEPKTWLYKGQIYLKIGTAKDFEGEVDTPLVQAYKAFRKCIDLDDKDRYSVEAKKNLKVMANHLYRAGVQSYNQKKFEDAYKKFKYTRELLPNDTALILSSAFAAQRSEKITAAKNLYKKLVSMKYDDKAAVYRSLSRIYQKEEKMDSALYVLGQGRKRFPDNKSLIIDELNLYLELDRLTEMVPKLRKATQVDSTNPNIQFALGTAYENLARKEKDSVKAETYVDSAVTAYKKAIDIKSDYFDAIYNLGALYYNEATELISKMNNIGVDQETKYNKLKRKRNELFNKSLPYLEKALELKPKDKNTLQALKSIYARLNSKEKYKEMKERLKELKNEKEKGGTE